MSRLWLFVALAALCSSQVRAEPPRHSDRELTDRVAEAIRTYPHYTLFDSIDIGVENGAARLDGHVTSRLKKDDIAQRVQKVEGIASVSNQIAVLPVSPADDDLRYRVARAIYSHPSFWVYAQMPVPSVHIVVERGRIMLTGAVDSEIHRRLASSLAQVSGSLGVTNRIKIDVPPGSHTGVAVGRGSIWAGETGLN